MGDPNITNPTIFLGSFEFREPVTTITDLMIAAVGWYAFYKFYTHRGQKTESFRFFLFYFFFLGFGMTCASIIGHALQAYLTPSWKAIGWTLAAIGVMFLELGVLSLIAQMIKRVYKQLLLVLILLHSITLVVLMFFPETRDFRFNAANTAIGLLGFSLPMLIFHAVKMKSKGSWITASAIAFGFTPLIIYIFKFSFDEWFNYHDISHILMTISASLMFIGTWRLGTKPPSV